MGVAVECDLRGMFGPVRDQGARPTCMAFAASDGHAAARDGWEPLSCEFAYYHALQKDGGDPNGGDPNHGVTLSGMLEAIRVEGQPPETQWNYLPNIPDDIALWKPPANVAPLYKRQSVYDTATILKVKGKLDVGTPVIITMSLSNAFYMPDQDGVIENDEPPDPARRHAVVAIGHGTKGTERFYLVTNSWGVTWGIDGCAWISEAYLAPRLNDYGEMKEDLTNVSGDHA